MSDNVGFQNFPFSAKTWLEKMTLRLAISMKLGHLPKCAIFGTCLLISHQKTLEWNYWYRVYTVIRLRGRTREVGQIRLLGLHWPAFTQWSRSRSRPRNWGRSDASSVFTLYANAYIDAVFLNFHTFTFSIYNSYINLKDHNISISIVPYRYMTDQI